jgi:large subunit ribosomal protein L34e
MTAPKHKSRSNKRVKVKLPGGKTVTHYKEKKPSKHICGRCGKTLTGVPSKSVNELANMSKTEKVPERPYAGVLCTQCTQMLFTYKARMDAVRKNPDMGLQINRDLTIEKYLPANWTEAKVAKPKKEKAAKKTTTKKKTKE